MRHEEGSIDVDREGPLEILVRGCQEGFIGYNAGGVDVDVDSTEVLDDLEKYSNYYYFKSLILKFIAKLLFILYKQTFNNYTLFLHI